MSCDSLKKTPRGFTAVTSEMLKNSVARRLVPIADRMRDIHTRFGMRPYTLKLIKTRHAGGRRHLGTEEVTFTRIFDPTPKIVSLSTLTEVVQPVGEDEIGTVQVEQVSAAFTEDMLRGFDDQGRPPGPDESVFYVIEFPTPGDGPGVMRRFQLRSAPDFRAGRFGWSFSLERAHQDPARDGSLR
jgi:hypothetical protein